MNYWYALHAKPHHEKQVDTFLAARGIETYLPLLSTQRLRAGKKVHVIQPLFPCYLFAQFDLDVVGMSTIRWTPGLRDLVTFGEKPAIVDSEFIDEIKFRLDEGEIRRRLEQPRFQRGEWVRVHSGPFSELAAVFEQSLPGNLRAQILVNILGRMTLTEVDMDALESRAQIRRPVPARRVRRMA